MTLPRFHVDVPMTVGSPCNLPRAATRHALRALRLRQGDMLMLFDGRGGQYTAQLVAAREPEAEVQVVRFDEVDVELPWTIVVAQGLSSGDRMDWTIGKSVELGAAAVVPLAMARSVVRLSAERALSRRQHWQALAIAASEQCGRNRVATVEPVASLTEWLAGLDAGDGAADDDAADNSANRIVLVPSGSSLASFRAPTPGHRVLVLAGPEGGFTDDELQAADTAGFKALSLGPRVLRTETAIPVAIAMLTARWQY